MKYVELSIYNTTIEFSKEAVKCMKIKENSLLLVFRIKGQEAFGFQERKKEDGDKILLCIAKKPKQYSRKLRINSDIPLPGRMLYEMNILKPRVKLELKERVNEQGQIIYYIGTWKN